MSNFHPDTTPTANSVAASHMATRTVAGCALLAALAVVLARFIVPMPDETARFSIESVPYFLAGMLYGPVAGGLVGFTADLIGCLFSGYGFNPLFCVPPILYGVCAGLFQPFLLKKISLPRIFLAFLPAVVFGSILYQSASLAFVYGGDAFMEFFVTKLGVRSIQFSITIVVDTLIVWLLYKSNVFKAAKLWPPMKYKFANQKKEVLPNDRNTSN